MLKPLSFKSSRYSLQAASDPPVGRDDDLERGRLSGLCLLSPGAGLALPRLNFLEPCLAESHLTTAIPLDHRIRFVGLPDSACIPSRLSEVAQPLDSISWIQFLTCWSGRGEQGSLSAIEVCIRSGSDNGGSAALLSWGARLARGNFICFTFRIQPKLM
jgi:hypothetical protein